MALSYQDIQASRAAARDAKAAAEKQKPTHDNTELDAMLASPIFKDYKPRPHQDTMMRQLDMASYLMHKSGNLTLTPILPLLLAIKGKPYRLQNHFPFAPFFRTRLARTILLKTGRQVSKSTSLAAQGLIFSAGIPHFSTMFITPLFEQIRRFSQNYVAKFLDTSPVGQLFCDTSAVSNVLQRSFRNHSQMIFSFAYLDAERTRGISADKNCFVTGTPVTLRDGSTMAIERLLPGMYLLSADKNGIIREDTVTDLLDQGKQHVFEVTFSNGSVAQCTADERFRKASDGEWVYLSDLVPEAAEIAKEDHGSRLAEATIGRCFDLQPETASLGLFTRRRHDSQIKPNSKLSNPVPSWTKAKRVLREQGRTTVQLCDDSASRNRESRVRESICCVQHGHQSISHGDRRTGHGERQEDRHEGLGRSTGLGGNCLLVHGRRKSSHRPQQLSYKHSRVLPVGMSIAGRQTIDIGAGGSRGSGERQETKQDVLRYSADSRCFSGIVAEDSPVDAHNNAIQVVQAEAVGGVLGMRGGFSGQARSSARQDGGVWRRGLSQSETPQTESALFDAGSQIDQERQAARAICGEAKITAVRYAGVKQVWDINTQREHAFFASEVLSHNCIDEVQDMDISLLPIIHETISASVDWGLIQYAGTPKTLDNTIEVLWQDSSMAEWVIKCPHPGCHHWNIPSLEYDLIDMIGPPHEDISETRPGVCCAKCGKPVSPRPVHQGGTGRWVHRRPELRWDFAGYHVPQLVMPMHYAIPEKWQKVIDKRDGKGNTPRNVFFNEVCGESYDAGAKLITDTDLRRAAILPWRNTLDEARKQISEYTHRIVAVDWGGGGVTRGKSDWTRQSYTTAAVLGFLPDGRIDVIYGYRSLHPHAHVREAKILLRIMAHFDCSHLAHDYTGAGTVRETVLIHAGVPVRRILPVAYTGPVKGNLIHFKPATNIHPRAHYTMDRNRSLNYCCQFIKSGIIRFFQYDYQNSSEPGLLRDFLSLIEDKSENGTGKDKYKILRDPAGPDDFAHSVNIGSMMLFHMAKHWPDLSNYEDVAVDDATLLSLNEVVMDDWLL